MTDSQRKLLITLKKLNQFTDSILTPVSSAIVLFLIVSTIEYTVNFITGNPTIGKLAFYTSIFLVAVNILSSYLFNYLANSYTTDSFNKLLQNGKDNSDRGHSRDDSGTGQSNSQDKTN